MSYTTVFTLQQKSRQDVGKLSKICQLSAGPVNIRDKDLVINVTADDLASNGAMPSAATMLTTKYFLSFFGY